MVYCVLVTQADLFSGKGDDESVGAYAAALNLLLNSLSLAVASLLVMLSRLAKLSRVPQQALGY